MRSAELTVPRALLVTACLVFAVTGSGCAPSTTVEVELALTERHPVGTLTVSAFDARGLLARRALKAPALPGTLEFKVNPNVGEVRVAAVTELGERGAGALTVVAAHQNRLGVTLSSAVVDADADGVADAVDNCVTTTNPDQDDRDADGRGDACENANGDAGSAVTDAGTPFDRDAGLGGPSRCPLSGALRCENFEAAVGMLSQEERATARVDPSNHARGQYAALLHADAVPGQMSVYARYQDPTSLPRAEWYARFFVLLDPSSVPENGALFEARYSPTYELLSLVYGSGGRLSLQRVQSPAFALYANDPLPLGRWVCIEIGVKQMPNAQVQVWVDDVEVPSLSPPGGITAAPSYDAALFGLAWYPQANHAAVDVWLDEAVVMTERIGCDR